MGINLNLVQSKLT